MIRRGRGKQADFTTPGPKTIFIFFKALPPDGRRSNDLVAIDMSHSENWPTGHTDPDRSQLHSSVFLQRLKNKHHRVQSGAKKNVYSQFITKTEDAKTAQVHIKSLKSQRLKMRSLNDGRQRGLPNVHSKAKDRRRKRLRRL